MWGSTRLSTRLSSEQFYGLNLELKIDRICDLFGSSSDCQKSETVRVSSWELFTSRDGVDVEEVMTPHKIEDEKRKQ